MLKSLLNHKWLLGLIKDKDKNKVCTRCSKKSKNLVQISTTPNLVYVNVLGNHKHIIVLK